MHLDDWPDFVFGDPDADLVPPRRDLGQVVTDTDGDIDWDVPLPDLPDYHGWLRLNAAVEVVEPGGGRAVTGHCAVDFAPTTHLLGLHNLSADQSDYVEPGQDLRFAAVLVDNQGHAVSAAGAEVRVLRRHWRTVLRRGSR